MPRERGNPCNLVFAFIILHRKSIAMPLLPDDYRVKNPLFRNPHVATIVPARFRRVKMTPGFTRVRWTTPDQDFIECDLSPHRSDRVVFLVHGFEGDSRRSYMQGMAVCMISHGWDVVMINLRGCSGEPNRLARAYHAGDTGDLEEALSRVRQLRNYSAVGMIGFSLGGNIVLNYLAGDAVSHSGTIGGVAVSVPIDLRETAFRIMHRDNWLYHRNFLVRLKRKMKKKRAKYPDLLPYKDILSAKNIDEIDERYTAPFHGFADATRYREKASALFRLKYLKRPALIINARDDTFLTESCYPYHLAEQSEKLYLLTPAFGGHCGFRQSGKTYYHEEKAAWFLSFLIG